MKYLILFLFPIFLQAQRLEVTQKSNAFGGLDTLKAITFYSHEIDTTSSNPSTYKSVYTVTGSFIQENNTLVSELIVNQSGTSDPTYLTLNSDVGIIDITYSSVGTYLFEDRVSSFVSGKTFLFIQNRNGSSNFTVDYDYVDANTLRIFTKSSGTLTNRILNNCFLKLVTYK